MKFFTHFSRLFVGVLFIISGLIKLNDPIGFSYKLTEYFGESVFNLPFFVPFSLAIALILVVLEVVLGFALLVGYRSKLTIKTLLLLIVLFTFLTFYSAFFDVVKDCGCFGDALHLTPWQSFGKDIVLLFFSLILVFNIKNVKPLFSKKTTKYLTILSLFLAIFMGYWVLNHNPIHDFRPFRVGNNIQKEMEIPADAPKTKVEMIFIYKVKGIDTEFSENDLMKLPAGATFVDRKDKIIEQGFEPPIHDFSMELDGSDYKDELLLAPKLLVFVAYDLAKANKNAMLQLEKLAQNAKAKGYTVIAMTGSANTEIEKAKAEYHFSFDIYFCDATPLKTIERANPSIVILNKGTVVQKVHYNDIDDLNL